MNRREDPLLRQHRSRLMQLVEVTNIRPGRGNGKRRGQRSAQGSSPSGNGGNAANNARVTLQDIVRSDPGYTSNIEHLVFPERKNSNPNLQDPEGSPKVKNKGQPVNSGVSFSSSSGMSRIAEVFARHYARGGSQDSNLTSRKNHVNSVSLDGGNAQSSRQSSSVKSSSSSSVATGILSTCRGGGGNGERRWLAAQNSQPTGTTPFPPLPQPPNSLSSSSTTGVSHSQQISQQTTRQHNSTEDGATRGDNSGPNTTTTAATAATSSSSSSSSSKAPRRLSPSVDPAEHSVQTNATRSSERGPNISILHLRGASDTREPSTTASYSSSVKSSTKSSGSGGSNVGSRNSYPRNATARLDAVQNVPTSSSIAISSSNNKQRSQESLHQERPPPAHPGTQRRREDSFLSGSGGTSGELFASGNCSRELSPVRWCDREVDGVYLGRSGWVQVQQRSLDENRKTSYESGRANPTSTGTLPLPRRATVKLADYHCSNSEPGNCPDMFTSSSLRPDFLALHGQGFEPSAVSSPVHNIPESFSPPSITPIISPPPAFQDSTKKKSGSSRNHGRIAFGKPPFLPRSNAIVDSDVISPPPSPSPSQSSISPSQNIVNWGSLGSSPTRTNQCTGNSVRSRRQTPSPVSTPQQQTHRLSQAKSLEDQTTGNRRTQFVQRYKESSSSSSSSMGFRSLDSCVNRGIAMPRLSENTDSSIEGYEDGDEDDNPSSSINLTSISPPLLNSSPDSIRTNGDKISPSSSRPGRISQYHCSRGQMPRRSPGSNDTLKQIPFNSPSSSSSSSGDRQGRSPTPNPNFRKNNNPGINHNHNRQEQNRRINTTASPDSLQTRVRRSRSLQLPERKSPGSISAPPNREHFREPGDPHRVVVKIAANERTKRHVIPNRKAQSTDSALNNELLREAEVVTEFLYGTRSRAAARNLLTNRQYDRRDDVIQDQRRPGTGTGSSYEVYFIPPTTHSGKPPPPLPQQQHNNQRPRTLQRGATTPSSELSPESNNEMCKFSPDTLKSRCNSSTCSFWPYCSQRDNQIYSPGQNNSAFSSSMMKMSQSYPAHNRMTLDSGQSHNTVGRNSASSSPASLEQMDERVVMDNLKNRDKNRHRRTEQGLVTETVGKNQQQQKNIVIKPSRKSPAGQVNIGISECRDYLQHKSTGSSFEGVVSTGQNKLSPSGGVGASSTSSSSSDIWVTTSDRTVTKSPRNAKSSGASTPMEDAMIGSFVTLAETTRDTMISRPGSAPAQREDSESNDAALDPHQRSLSLPKSFLAHNIVESGSSSSNAGSTPWHRGFDSRRSTPSPNCLIPQETPPPHTAPVSPLHEQLGSNGLKERRRIPTLNKAQRRAKASSTPALLERDQDGCQWSAADDERIHKINVVHPSTEHPIVEATIPLVVSQVRLQECNNTLQQINNSGNNGSHVQLNRHNVNQNQESVLQKFRKSFSLRFHKKGSKDSFDGNDTTTGNGNGDGCHPPLITSDDSNHLISNIDDDDIDRDSSIQTQHHSQQNINQQAKEDHMNDQKFRFGPLVWRTSKERKKSSKAARSAKCNSGDSGIQIEMVSGNGALTGVIGGSGGGGGVTRTAQGDSSQSESHDTDQQDDIDSPPALRRRVNDKSRPQSELVNQILIDKFKADLQNRTITGNSSSNVRHNHVRRTNSDLGGQRLLQWDTRSGYSHAHNYRRMLSTPSPIKTRPPRLSPRHSSNDIVTLRSNSKGRINARTNLRRSLSQPLGINQLSPLMRAKNSAARLPSGNNILSEDEHDSRCGGGGGGGSGSGIGGGGTSEDEMMSDSESSIASLTDRKKSFEQTMDEDNAILAEAVWDHVAIEPEELAFRAGDVIDVLDTIDRDWWWGSCRNEHGWFPAAFVRLRVGQEDTVEDCLAAMASGVSTSSQLRRRTSVSLLSNEQVRTSVVRELVQTERDFVKILRDVTEGYISECRRRTDMFNEEQIEAIFINIEELLDFQSAFLKDLEQLIDWNYPHKSCVGECFLNHRSGFRMYSEYCNSHPMAMATLQELYQHNRYSKFFEGCRLMRGLIEIPLDGYLLTPVQRICKYPLQLAELLKYTKSEHPDYEKIKEALEAMRGVAVLINERKRRMESLEKLAAWQQRVEGWEAEDLIEVSSQLIHQGEVIRVTTGMWTNNITLFLFDHQLVYCKKDILKRNTYVYKGRIYLDTSEVIDVPDGKDPQLGVTVRHCLKVYSCVRDKWLLFCCRNAEEKRHWLSAMAEERRLVQQDRNDGLDFPPAARQLAKIAATRERCRPPSKPSNKTYKRNSAYEVPILSGQQGSGTNSLGRKVGTWFTFGGNKKTGSRHHNQPS